MPHGFACSQNAHSWAFAESKRHMCEQARSATARACAHHRTSMCETHAMAAPENALLYMRPHASVGHLRFMCMRAQARPPEPGLNTPA